MKEGMLRAASKRLNKALGDQRGVGLTESLVAVAILGIALVVFITALSTGLSGVGTVDEQVMAESVARSQLEYTKSQEYLTAPVSYDTITPPAGFNVTAEASLIPDLGAEIQKITVTVYHNGEVLLVVEDYKVNR
jgi:prepilin-type N-terminal cleavage/methylation domain-containing protein